MASHNQSYRADETKGRAEEKTNQTMGSLGDKAREGKDMAYEKTQEAKDYTNSAMGSLGEKAREGKDKTYETAEAAKEKTSSAAQSAKEKASQAAETVKEKTWETDKAAREKAEAGKGETGGIIQKTGEQVKSMAQGALDALKHTAGIATFKMRMQRKLTPLTPKRGIKRTRLGG
ncbi:late embryogenesis abundant protein 2 [Quercus suber]|uniref:Late embryogenesis abundant protein 1 n=1 Tax=Quercus suber TaxID=58331 RepID=A0AAW0KCR6_QUESU|nr:late embryogenesis abundant protein 2-like [Quercus suber]POE78406.1 late embryogenesis abundant protein 1 [Quercus suber]